MNRKLTKLVNLLLILGCLIVLLFCIQLFCFTTFKIPSSSMEPTLKNGDRILVNKMIKGARLFDVLAVINGDPVDIYRTPGLKHLQRNDVLVFNFPYQCNQWDDIEIDMMRYYIKRCIALPGDTLEIKNGFYKIRGFNDHLGNYKAQRHVASLRYSSIKCNIVETYPYNRQLGWNIWEFGPLLIPRRDQMVEMNYTNYLLYKQLIAWEQKKELSLQHGKVLLEDSLVCQYKFTNNYYFMSGDNMISSEDSRYWGMLPETCIVGKATYILYSKNDLMNKVCWNRILKKIK